MTSPQSTEGARPNLYALLAAMLSARDDALSIGFTIRVDAAGIDSWPGHDEQTAPALNRLVVTKETAEKVAAAWHTTATEFNEALLQLARDSHTLAELRANIPGSFAEAMIAWHFVQREYESALEKEAAALTEYRSLDDAMGRVRRECGRKIQDAHLAANPGAKPIADTPLNAQAGDHPEYVAHREQMTAAQEVAEHWSARVKSLAGRLDIARVVAENYGRSSVTIVERDALSAADVERLADRVRESAKREQRMRGEPAQGSPIYREPGSSASGGVADSAR